MIILAPIFAKILILNEFSNIQICCTLNGAKYFKYSNRVLIFKELQKTTTIIDEK